MSAYEGDRLGDRLSTEPGQWCLGMLLDCQGSKGSQNQLGIKGFLHLLKLSLFQLTNNIHPVAPSEAPALHTCDRYGCPS